VRVPPWVTLGVAVLVIVFGLYRIRMSLKKPDPNAAKKSVMGGGLYRISPKAHLVIGLLYLALGGALIATTFGWSPLSGFGTKTEPPATPKKLPGGIEMSK
jgi:hypothetical protein